MSFMRGRSARLRETWREFFAVVTPAVTRRATCEVNTHAHCKTLQPRGRCVGGKVLLIAYTVDISATGGATMRNNEAIINESRLTVVRERSRCFNEFPIKLSHARSLHKSRVTISRRVSSSFQLSISFISFTPVFFFISIFFKYLPGIRNLRLNFRITGLNVCDFISREL